MAAVRPFEAQLQLAPSTGHAGTHPRAANDPAIDALSPTVFHEHWWLDVVTQRRWRAAEVRSDGKLIAWMPYVLDRRRGFTVSVMPMLAHLLGPAIALPGDGKAAWLRRLGAIRELVGRLPKVAHFSQTCHPGMRDVLAFQGCGFESFVQFSAEVAPQEERLLWAATRDKTRNVIRRAAERHRVETIEDPCEFRHLYDSNLRRSGERAYFDTALITPLYEAAASRGQARILGARAGNGELAAAVLLASDRRRLWYFLSTRDARCAGNGAVPLLVWEAIRHASAHRLVFDFDGIVGEGAARFYTTFGAAVRPRFAVWKRSAAYALFTSAVDVLRGGSRRNTFNAP